MLPPVEIKPEVKVGVKVGNYTRKVFDDDFESEWDTLSKYDSELQVIIEKIMSSVDDEERRAKVFDELKSLYKIMKNVEGLEPAVNKMIGSI